MRLGELGHRHSLLPANVQGLSYILAATAGFSIMSMLVKMLGQSLDSVQIAFFRCLFGLLALLPFAAASGWRTVLPRHLGHHLARAGVGVAGMFCGFYALTHLPLATVTAISFTKPLFMIPLAILMIGERVHWRRGAATLIGFFGVLLIIRPMGGTLEAAMLSALAQALLTALVALLIRTMPSSEKPLTIVLFFSLSATLLMLVPASVVWREPTMNEWFLAAAIGATGSLSQWLITIGYRMAQPTAVSVGEYSSLIFATTLGLIFFAEIPDMWTFAGAMVIIASTTYIAHREARIGKQTAHNLYVTPVQNRGDAR